MLAFFSWTRRALTCRVSSSRAGLMKSICIERTAKTIPCARALLAVAERTHPFGPGPFHEGHVAGVVNHAACVGIFQ